MIPLAEAHRSGAYAWTSEVRQSFANDLANRDALIAVWLSQNRSKGDRDPSEWLPLNRDYHQEYALAWVRVKVKYKLTSDSKELAVPFFQLVVQNQLVERWSLVKKQGIS